MYTKIAIEQGAFAGGATIVWVPGLLSDRFAWQAVADLVGDARASWFADVTAGGSITDMARSFLGAVEGPVIPVGHSMGGRIALEMARLAPERVVGLVLANTGYRPKREGEEVKRREMVDLGHESMERLADVWLPPMLDPARVTDAELVADLRAMVLRADADIHERQIRALVERPDAGAHLGEITCPVLLITGRQDGWSPIAQHREIAEAVGDAELVVIENAGHFAPVERPEDVAATIASWLEKRRGDFAC